MSSQNQKEPIFDKERLKQDGIELLHTIGFLIIENTVAVLKGEKTPQEAAVSVAKATGEEAAQYVEVFSQEAIERILKNTSSEFCSNLADNGLPDVLVDLVKQVAVLSAAYLKKKITGTEFAKTLMQYALKNIFPVVWSTVLEDEKIGPIAEGVQAVLRDENMGVIARCVMSVLKDGNIGAMSGKVQSILNLAGSTLGFMAAVSVFEDMKSAVDEYHLAVEQRKIVEAQCAEAIERIYEYRREMNENVERYLSEHLSTFNDSFAQMDKAIVEGDIHGYVSGNVKIQELLGKELQFRTAEEFDDLMLSDENFKL